MLQGVKKIHDPLHASYQNFLYSASIMQQVLPASRNPQIIVNSC